MVRRMLVAVLVGALAPVVVVPVAAAHAAPACLAQASDAAAARAAARTCGGRVEVGSARTEYTQVFQNPDGTASVEIYAYPQRVKRADGSWANLDATLTANADGTLSPKAAMADVVVSGGGADRLVSARRGAAQVALSWPGRLPKPVVSGAQATYPEVVPGVAVVVTAHATGFSEVVVVKNRAAAANPAVRRLVLGASLSGVHWRGGTGADSDLQAVDETGKTVFAATAPRMWDSSPSPASIAAAAGGRAKGDVSGPAEGARSSRLGLALSGNGVTLTPDLAMLDDPAVTFPVYLDPTLNYTAWTMINDEFPDQPYWSYDKTDCPPNFTATECAKVGNIYGGTMDYRSLFQFPTSQILGKQILDADFTIDILHSASTAASVTELHPVNATLDSGTTWRNNAGAWGGSVASVSNTDANDVRKLTEIFGAGLTSTLQGIANGGSSWMTFGLKADTETSSSAWKKFDAKTAKLVVAINTLPNMPDSLTVDGKACASGNNRPFVATATPVLKSRVTDADGDSLDDWFAYAKWNGSSWVDTGGGHQTPIPNGGFGQITTAALVDGGIYTFRSQSNDSPTRGATYGTSPVTNVPGNCEWQVDLTDPDVPAVIGDVYKENCPSCGSVGQPGHFTFSSSADVTAFRWGFSDPPSNTINLPTLGATASLDWTPTPSDGGPKTLYVQAVDRAGRTRTKVYQFYVAPPSTAVARWLFDEPDGSTTLNDDTGNGHLGTLREGHLGTPGRIAPGNDGAPRTAVTFNGYDEWSGVDTDGPLIDTSKSFTVAAWVKLTDLTDTYAVIDQWGDNATPFMLGYEHEGQNWEFMATSADVEEPDYMGAYDHTVPPLNVWTHLVGVYDSVAGQLRLYVNGDLVDETGGVTMWKSAGSTTIGSAWKGSLSEVQVWNRVLSGSEVADLSDPTKVGLVGKWDMSDVGPGPTYDGSPLVHDIDFYPQPGGPQIPPAGSGHTGTGLHLDGVDDYAMTHEPVIQTDQSFTVSAWVRLTSTANDCTVLAQENVYQYSSFYLMYAKDRNRWTFQLPSTGSGTVTWWAANSTAAPVLNSWTHLVGVYDATAEQIKLYVNDVLQSTVSGVTAIPGTGALFFGRSGSGYANSYLPGDIDEVRVYQGAVTNLASIS